MYDSLTLLGLTAGFCTTFALAPQAIKVWRTQRVDQLSIGMLGLMFVGAGLWLSYGFLRQDISIMWANAVAFVFITYMGVKKVADIRRTGKR